MKRRLKLTVTKIRRQTAAITKIFRVFCPICGFETEMLSLAEAAAFLEIKKEVIENLIAVGEVHAIQTVNGSRRVCKNSLFK